MGTSQSTPTIRPKDLERWNRQGRPVLIDERRRGRNPDGSRYVETRRRYMRGSPYGGFDLEGGLQPPIRGSGGGDGFGHVPYPSGLYPNPLGGPDLGVGSGFGAPARDRFAVFEPPIAVPQMPVFEEVDWAFLPRSRLGRQDNIHLGQPPPFMFVVPDDDFPPRRPHHPPPGHMFADNTFRPLDGRFDGEYGRHRSAGFGRRPAPSSFDFPDDTSLESWGPVRRGRRPSPGFIFAEDGVPLRGRTSRNS
ncbi:hypothetical protein PV04_06643 [Phialophora macrospora]|uniref:Uncharacterized protein n=1 Tax=Phialophora macrospora TaxID=1851006 RepID=A0A0D2G5V9_9EURO|nr:hypothetical protein PV04_06643 [Phialophora macrospora]